MEEGLAALGLRPTATADEVKAAYRRLAKKHHPDLNAGDPAAEEAFKRLTSAYTSAILGTARRDQRQQQQQQQQQTRTAGASRHARTAQRTSHSGQVLGFDVREWEAAHYGPRAAAERAQSHRVEEIYRLRRMHRGGGRASARARAGTRAPRAFGGHGGLGLFAMVAALTAVWGFVGHTYTKRFR